MERLLSWLDPLIPPSMKQGGNGEMRRARLLLLASLAVVVWAPFYALLYLFVDLVTAAWLALGTVGGCATIYVLRLTRSTAAAGNWLALVVFVAVAVTALRTGGHQAPSLLWAPGLPLVAFALVGWRSMIFWLAACLSLLTLFYGLAAAGIVVLPPHPEPERTLIELAAVAGLMVMLISVTWIYGRQTGMSLAEANERLKMEVREHRETQGRLRRAEQLEALGRMVASVGHEINNPLAYVTTNLEVLEEELAQLPVDGERQSRLDDLLQDAKLGAERIRGVVHNLGAFSRREGEMGPVDVPQVLSQSLRLVRNEARHRARIVEQVEPVAPVHAQGPELSRILVNVLLNAVDAMPVGHSDENEIRISVRQTIEHEVLVELTDTGPGIPAEHLERIFEPFFTTKEPGRGTGLGLAICHELVQRFGGDIEVRSQVGAGTTVAIRLRVARPEAGDPEARPDAGGTSPDAVPSGAAPRLQVLVIDDDQAMLRAVRRILRQHEVTAVDTGREAVQACMRHSPDVILCDLMMPDATGIQIYREIREARPPLARRFLFMTRGAIGPEAQAFAQRMESRMLPKPFEPELLRAHVRDMAGSGGFPLSSIPPGGLVAAPKL